MEFQYNDFAQYGCSDANPLTGEPNQDATLIHVNGLTDNKRLYFIWEDNSNGNGDYYISVNQGANQLLIDFPFNLGGTTPAPPQEDMISFGTAAGEINTADNVDNYTRGTTDDNLKYISLPFDVFNTGTVIHWSVKLRNNQETIQGISPCRPDLADTFGTLYIENRADIPGCTNPNADNYNPHATIDDNTCYFEVEPAEVITDIENNQYEIRDFGVQTWMTENVKSTILSDGFELTSNPGLNVWDDNHLVYAHYLNDNIGYKYHYQWGITDELICPNQDWVVPSVEDWITLFRWIEGYYGVESTDNDMEFNVGSYLKHRPPGAEDGNYYLCEAETTLWNEPTDSSGVVRRASGNSGNYYPTYEDCFNVCTVGCNDFPVNNRYTIQNSGHIEWGNNGVPAGWSSPYWASGTDCGTNPFHCEDTSPSDTFWNGENSIEFNAQRSNPWPQADGSGSGMTQFTRVLYWTSTEADGDNGYAIEITNDDLVKIVTQVKEIGSPVRCMYKPPIIIDCNGDLGPVVEGTDFGRECTEEEILTNVPGCAFYDTFCGLDGEQGTCDPDLCFPNIGTLEENGSGLGDCNCQCIGGGTGIEASFKTNQENIDACNQCFGRWFFHPNNDVDDEVNTNENRSELGCGCFQSPPQLHYPDNDRDAYQYDDNGNPTEPINPDASLTNPADVNAQLPYYFCIYDGGVPDELLSPFQYRENYQYNPPTSDPLPAQQYDEATFDANNHDFLYPFKPQIQENNFVPDWVDAPEEWYQTALEDNLSVGGGGFIIGCMDNGFSSYDLQEGDDADWYDGFQYIQQVNRPESYPYGLSALNYNPQATIDDGSCFYSEQPLDNTNLPIVNIQGFQPSIVEEKVITGNMTFDNGLNFINLGMFATIPIENQPSEDEILNLNFIYDENYGFVDFPIVLNYNQNATIDFFTNSNEYYILTNNNSVFDEFCKSIHGDDYYYKYHGEISPLDNLYDAIYFLDTLNVPNTPYNGYLQQLPFMTNSYDATYLEFVMCERIVETIDGEITIYKSELDEQVSISGEFEKFQSNFTRDVDNTEPVNPIIIDNNKYNLELTDGDYGLNISYSQELIIEPITDITFSKTGLTNYLFDEMGNPIIDFKYVDVVRDGVYQGVHILYPKVNLSHFGFETYQAPAGPIVINEFMASNDHVAEETDDYYECDGGDDCEDLTKDVCGITDGCEITGENADWVEFYNAGTKSVNMDELKWADGAQQFTMVQPICIQPEGFIETDPNTGVKINQFATKGGGNNGPYLKPNDEPYGLDQNPEDDVDFIEIYNGTALELNLENWQIINGEYDNNGNYEISDTITITTNNLTIPPYGYFTIIADKCNDDGGDDAWESEYLCGDNGYERGDVHSIYQMPNNISDTKYIRVDFSLGKSETIELKGPSTPLSDVATTDGNIVISEI